MDLNKMLRNFVVSATSATVLMSMSASAQINQSRSVFITDTQVLNEFSLGGQQGLLQALLDSSTDTATAPSDLIIGWAQSRPDCQSAEEISPGPNCLATGQDIDINRSLNNPSLDHYVPIVLANRFDLAPEDGAHCGEYRIAFRSGTALPNPSANENFLIFEARAQNPNTQAGLAGCLPIVSFWESLTEVDDTPTRAAMLKDFYFNGIPSANVAPIFQWENYRGENLNSGQIRINATNGDDNQWLFMEAATVRTCNGGSCSLSFDVATTKDNPNFSLISQDGTAADALRQAILNSIVDPGKRFASQ